MIKFLFFDYRDVETCEGFERKLEQPVKHEGPLFIADQPWENGNMQLYGSVIKTPDDGLFKCWYSVIHPPFTIYMCYAESEDGINWRRPIQDVFEWKGMKTNVVFPDEPHGPAIIYDAADPRPEFRYKMMCGAAPKHVISAFFSADGIHWKKLRGSGVINTHPDSPMAFLRAPDGRYVAHHRLDGFGRRIFRSESWDFKFWSGEPRMIMEPDAGDLPQTQFYGMGSAAYGDYEIGTLWMYHTEEDDLAGSHMRGYQEAELTYARSGCAWHRAAQGQTFIPHGSSEDWDRGNLQCASQPVYLDDEIRYYYMGTTMPHKTHWELDPQTAGLGMASIRPDRFVTLAADNKEAALMTERFTAPGGELFVNAKTGKDGWVKVQAVEKDATPVDGLDFDSCQPISGDSVDAPVRWRGGATLPTDRPVRLQIRAKNARLYSIFATEPEEQSRYYRFKSPRP